MKFLANLFGGGQEGVVRYALARQKAVRRHRRAETVGDIDRETADRMLREANCTREEADAIYKLTALEWQITIPPNGRLPSHGIAPAVIQWKSDVHPASKLAESSVSLLQVVGYHPDARQVTALLNAASFAGPFSVVEPLDGVPIGLTATFQTPRGVVVLS